MTFWYGQVAGTDAREPGGRAGHWLFTSRFGGFSKPPYDDWNLARHLEDDPLVVAANRARLSDVAGVGELKFMRQCHSAEVALVDDTTEGDVTDVDALVTVTPSLGVVALSADCVPVALLDAEAGVVAAVHSGWQGMVSDVVGAAIELMVEQGAELTRMRAALGPAICGSCYPVPTERAEQAATAWPDSWAQAPDGQPAIDVRAGLRQRLAALGIYADIVGGCTAEDPQLYSYRRDGETGRQGVAVWWTETP